MRIDARTNYLFASQATQSPAGVRSAAASLFATVTTAQADNVKRTDFTNMTRQEMRDWVDTQTGSGEMSLDDAFPFVAMTMKIPVDGGPEVPAAGDSTRYDFTQKIRDGIQGALSRNDQVSLKMLESAMQFIERNQGKAIGIDVRA